MSPGEEDEAELADHVGVGDIEVVLEGGNGHIAIELYLCVSNAFKYLKLDPNPYVMFHVFLPGGHCGLADLESHLCRWVIDEPAKAGGTVGPTTLCGRRLIWISPVSSIWGLLR